MRIHMVDQKIFFSAWYDAISAVQRVNAMSTAICYADASRCMSVYIAPLIGLHIYLFCSSVQELIELVDLFSQRRWVWGVEPMVPRPCQTRIWEEWQERGAYISKGPQLWLHTSTTPGRYGRSTFATCLARMTRSPPASQSAGICKMCSTSTARTTRSPAPTL
jgi:hypothetical protein